MACGGLRRRPSERPSPQPCPCSVLPAWCSCLVLPARCSPQPRPHPVLPAQCSPPGSPAWCSPQPRPGPVLPAQCSPHSAPRLVLPPSAPAWCSPHGAPCSPAWAQCSPHSAPCPRLVLPAQRSHTCTWVLGGGAVYSSCSRAGLGRPSEGVDAMAPARSWTGDCRKTTLPAPPPRRGPALADLCPLLALSHVHGPDAAAGCRLGRGSAVQSLPEDLPCCAGHGGKSSGFVGFGFCLQGEGWARGGETDVSRT